jgi:hypothetical protein
LDTSLLGGLGLAVVLGAVVVALPLLAVTIWAFVDVLRRPAHQWDVAGQPQMVWALGIGIAALTGFGPLAALVYLLVAVPRLRAAQARQAAVAFH